MSDVKEQVKGKIKDALLIGILYNDVFRRTGFDKEQAIDILDEVKEDLQESSISSSK